MFRLAFLIAAVMLVNPSKACDNIEVMICSSELRIFDSLVLEDGTPNVAAICGRQAEFSGLADKCEAQARICNDNTALASIATTRTSYAKSVDDNCNVATEEPEEVTEAVVEPAVEPVVEEEIVPEKVTYNQCNMSPTRLLEVCRGRFGGPDATCQNVQPIRHCIRAFALANGCNAHQIQRFELRLTRKLSFICTADD